jgi:ornithine carbamoyltransferase
VKKMKMQGKDFLSIYDLSLEEINLIFRVAEELKSDRKIGKPHPYLQGKTLGMIFQKSSTRTRVSFEVGMYQLGGNALYLNGNDIQLGRGETIADTAQVLSRYVDGIMIRTFSHQEVEELAHYASVPVINGLTDLLHPCQIMADLFTIKEKKGTLKGLKLAYIGDGNNVAHSLLYGCSKVGMDISIASPEGYKPDSRIVEQASQLAKSNGSRVLITEDPVEAAQGADVFYTDVWASMGQESEQAERMKVFAGYQVNSQLLTHGQPDPIFLHCLPAHRGEEVTGEVIDGPYSAVFDEAENRLHVQKAIMALLIR